MNIDRINRAIEILERVPEGKFDLGSWAEFTKEEHTAPDFVPKLNGCGTTGCAMGWIASDKDCIAEGLFLKAYHSFDGDFLGVEPAYGNDIGFRAAKEYFGITGDQTYELFDPDRYPERDHDNPDAVIERLEHLRDHASFEGFDYEGSDEY